MARLDEKHKISGNYEKIFKRFLQKFVKMLYFSIFFKRCNKPMRSFFAVWTKNTNCWDILRKFWKFLMKIQLKNWILLWFLENLLLKIEPSEITQFYYNNFFGFGGGDSSPPLPPLPPLNPPMYYNVFDAEWENKKPLKIFSCFKEVSKNSATKHCFH